MSSQSFRFDSPFIFNPSKSEDLTSSTFGLAETKIICLYFDLNNFNFPRSFLISMLINFLINLSRLFLIEKIKEEKVARTWWKFFCISFDVGKSRRSLDSGAKRKKKKKEKRGKFKVRSNLGQIWSTRDISTYVRFFFEFHLRTSPFYASIVQCWWIWRGGRYSSIDSGELERAEKE